MARPARICTTWLVSRHPAENFKHTCVQYGLCRGTAQAPARIARPVGPCHAGGQMRLHPDARQHGMAGRAVRAGWRPPGSRPYVAETC